MKLAILFIPKTAHIKSLSKEYLPRSLENSKNDVAIKFLSIRGKEGKDNWVDGVKVGQEVRYEWQRNTKQPGITLEINWCGASVRKWSSKHKPTGILLA